MLYIRPFFQKRRPVLGKMIFSALVTVVLLINVILAQSPPRFSQDIYLDTFADVIIDGSYLLTVSCTDPDGDQVSVSDLFIEPPDFQVGVRERTDGSGSAIRGEFDITSQSDYSAIDDGFEKVISITLECSDGTDPPTLALVQLSPVPTSGSPPIFGPYEDSIYLSYTEPSDTLLATFTVIIDRISPGPLTITIQENLVSAVRLPFNLTCLTSDCFDEGSVTDGTAILTISQSLLSSRERYELPITASDGLYYTTILVTIYINFPPTFNVLLTLDCLRTGVGDFIESTPQCVDGNSAFVSSNGVLQLEYLDTGTAREFFNLTSTGYLIVTKDLKELNTSVEEYIELRCSDSGTPTPYSTIIKLSFECGGAECGDPGTVANGKIFIPEGTFYPSGIVYSCDEGFFVNGSAVRTCQLNSSWSGAAPTCDVVHCEELQDIPNGMVIFTSTQYQSVAAYSCFHGYSLQGGKDRTCLSTGSWSSVEPTCQLIDCGNPPDGENLQVTASEGTGLDDEATYLCNTGYETSDGLTTVKRMCMENGKWSGQDFSCQRVDCGIPSDILYGSVQVSGTDYLSTGQYRCSPGYTLVGNVHITCEANRRWSGSRPSCQFVECSNDPDSILNGEVVMPDGRTFQSVAYYRCNEGYQLDDLANAILVCSEDGEWEGKVPQCEVIPEMATPSNQQVEDVPVGTIVGSVIGGLVLGIVIGCIVGAVIGIILRSR